MRMKESLGHPALIEWIHQQIGEHTDEVITFHDFMAECLYHPEFGYYNTVRPKVGKEGDFYTSSSIGSLMGEMLANYVLSLIATWKRNPDQSINIVEWGAGTGRLAADLLDEVKRMKPDLYERISYTVIEKSSYHRLLQQEILQRHGKKVTCRSEREWLNEGPYSDVIVISNELLDALPVHKLIYTDQGWREIGIGWIDVTSTFEERIMLVHDKQIHQYLFDYIQVPVMNQIVEVNLEAALWIKKVAHQINTGYLITIDYGDVATEIHAKHRMNGTLLCYHQHQASDEPLLRVGEQDMTSHVNFTACQDVGNEVGLSTLLYCTQKQFLMEAGIVAKLQDHAFTDPFHPVVKRNRAIRQLLLSDQMSELFKVLVQTK